MLEGERADPAPVLEVGAVIDAVIDAFNARDLEGFLACYAAEATIEDGEGVVLANGQDQIRARYGEMFKDFPNLHVEPLGRLQVDAYAAQEERVTGRAAEPERHIAVYRVSSGRIVVERLLT